MTWQELQNQALELPLGDRRRLVQSLLSSIQQETLLLSSPNPPNPDNNSMTNFDHWTQSLMGVIQLGAEKHTESYVDYLEEKYH